MGFEIKGLKEVQDKLKKLQEDAENLNGQSVPLSDVLTESFISENTRFENLDKLIEASGFKVESQDDFEAIPDDEWDMFISTQTQFDSWQELINTAGAIYAEKQLGL